MLRMQGGKYNLWCSGDIVRIARAMVKAEVCENVV